MALPGKKWPSRHLPRQKSERSLLIAIDRVYSILCGLGVKFVNTMTYTESRAKYAETLNSVVRDREEVIITRAGHDPVVIVALDDYESLKQTAYLLQNPENARRLLASIDRLEHGKGAARDLVERRSFGTKPPGTTTLGGSDRIRESLSVSRSHAGYPTQRKPRHWET